MGWTSMESTLDRLQNDVAQDPRAAVRRILGLLQTAQRPTDTVRLLGFLSAAYKHLGDVEASQKALDEASRIPRASRLARAELETHRVALQICCRQWRQGRDSVERVLEALPAPSERRSGWGLRQERTRKRLEATALIQRGRIKLIAEADRSGAKEDACRAAELEPPPRQRLAAATLLARAYSTGGTVKEILVAAEIIEAAIASHPSWDPISYGECRICRAVIVARFGATAQAERMIRESLSDYRRLGALQNYRAALEVLAWVIAERDGKPDRARLVVRDLRSKEPGIGST